MQTGPARDQSRAGCVGSIEVRWTVAGTACRVVLAIGIVMGAGGLASLARAQGVPQVVSLPTVDEKNAATGYRSTKMVGSKVVNELGQTIGTIDDLIVTPAERVPVAVLSVGGFLGLGARLVLVPFSALKPGDGHMVLPGASKDTLRALPAFRYAN